MKIRIKGNSLRLRLTQSEVEEFTSNGRVSDSIHFGENQLIYTLQSEDRGDVVASFNGEFITVTIPRKEGEQWASTEQVGISRDQPLKNNERLSILIEKDFQCLIPRKEDESDLFTNPKA
ncbi:MAG: hypothetical protein ABJH05_02860 [Fulvivirga sp.]